MSVLTKLICVVTFQQNFDANLNPSSKLSTNSVVQYKTQAPPLDYQNHTVCHIFQALFAGEEPGYKANKHTESCYGGDGVLMFVDINIRIFDSPRYALKL